MATLSDEDRARMQRVHTDLAKTATLVNFDGAVQARTADGTAATWVPIQPGVPGGRPSIYDLEPGTETLMGYYVTAGGVVQEYMTRIDDDNYAIRQASREGEEIFSGTGTMELLEPSVGYGSIVFKGKDTTKPQKTSIWYVWSFIKVDKG